MDAVFLSLVKLQRWNRELLHRSDFYVLRAIIKNRILERHKSTLDQLRAFWRIAYHPCCSDAVTLSYRVSTMRAQPVSL